MRPVQARARQQLDSAAVQPGVHAISVILDLMQPVLALRGRVYQFAKLWLDPTWKYGRIALRLLFVDFVITSAGSVGIYTGGPSKCDHQGTANLPEKG